TKPFFETSPPIRLFQLLALLVEALEIFDLFPSIVMHLLAFSTNIPCPPVRVVMPRMYLVCSPTKNGNRNGRLGLAGTYQGKFFFHLIYLNSDFVPHTGTRV